MLGMLFASFWSSTTGVIAMAGWNDAVSDTLVYLAILVTATAMVAQYALWHFAMRLIPRYVTNGARAIGVIVVCVLLIALGLASTFTSFLGLTQDSAQSLELTADADRYAGKAGTLAARAAAMEDALFVVQPQAKAACVRYDRELESGVLTGARGKGVVTGYLLRFCETKRAMAEALEETIAANAQRMDRIQTLSTELDQILLDRSMLIEDRKLLIITRAREMDGLLRQLQNADRTKGLRASFHALANSVVELEGQQGGLAGAQQQAVASIAAEEKAAWQAIDGLLREIEALPLPTPERASIKPPQEIVVLHWKAHLPQLAIAGTIDLFAPLSILLFWAAAMRVRAVARNERDFS